MKIHNTVIHSLAPHRSCLCSCFLVGQVISRRHDLSTKKQEQRQLQSLWSNVTMLHIELSASLLTAKKKGRKKGKIAIQFYYQSRCNSAGLFEHELIFFDFDLELFECGDDWPLCAFQDLPFWANFIRHKVHFSTPSPPSQEHVNTSVSQWEGCTYFHFNLRQTNKSYSCSLLKGLLISSLFLLLANWRSWSMK